MTSPICTARRHSFPPAVRFRPRLEMLEGRVVPSHVLAGPGPLGAQVAPALSASIPSLAPTFQVAAVRSIVVGNFSVTTFSGTLTGRASNGQVVTATFGQVSITVQNQLLGSGNVNPDGSFTINTVPFDLAVGSYKAVYHFSPFTGSSPPANTPSGSGMK